MLASADGLDLDEWSRERRQGAASSNGARMHKDGRGRGAGAAGAGSDHAASGRDRRGWCRTRRPTTDPDHPGWSPCMIMKRIEQQSSKAKGQREKCTAQVMGDGIGELKLYWYSNSVMQEKLAARCMVRWSWPASDLCHTSNTRGESHANAKASLNSLRAKAWSVDKVAFGWRRRGMGRWMDHPVSCLVERDESILDRCLVRRTGRIGWMMILTLLATVNGPHVSSKK